LARHHVPVIYLGRHAWLRKELQVWRAAPVEHQGRRSSMTSE
jgi:hypothetical protein